MSDANPGLGSALVSSFGSGSFYAAVRSARARGLGLLFLLAALVLALALARLVVSMGAGAVDRVQTIVLFGNVPELRYMDGELAVGFPVTDQHWVDAEQPLVVEVGGGKVKVIVDTMTEGGHVEHADNTVVMTRDELRYRLAGRDWVTYPIGDVFDDGFRLNNNTIGEMWNGMRPTIFILSTLVLLLVLLVVLLIESLIIGGILGAIRGSGGGAGFRVARTAQWPANVLTAIGLFLAPVAVLAQPVLVALFTLLGTGGKDA